LNLTFLPASFEAGFLFALVPEAIVGALYSESAQIKFSPCLPCTNFLFLVIILKNHLVHICLMEENIMGDKSPKNKEKKKKKQQINKQKGAPVATPK
jgi:hypothetical protein